MITHDFHGKPLSQLGFGTMRLPEADGVIDEAQVQAMVRHALENGVNYFDTAWPYHGGRSEVTIGRILRQYPRDSYFLGNKFPGHQISASYEPAPIFEEQLRRCGVEYFDFYMLHNVYENSLKTYLDPQWDILNYFLEQKRLGRIRHLGFSSHARVETLKEILDVIGDEMEFCLIQLNWLDWTLQDAKAKVKLLGERGIPVWVMEPLRGGRLCSLGESNESAMKALRPNEGIPAWSFRFLQEIPGVQMILSGMSTLEQMQQNTATFRERNPLSKEETGLLFRIAEELKDSIPCTRCGYCLPHCPLALDIPMLLHTLNEFRVSPALNIAMRLDALPVGKRSSACVSCRQCVRMCPQNIDVPAAMRELTDRLAQLPSWEEVCRQRDEELRSNPV